MQSFRLTSLSGKKQKTKNWKWHANVLLVLSASSLRPPRLHSSHLHHYLFLFKKVFFVHSFVSTSQQWELLLAQFSVSAAAIGWAWRALIGSQYVWHIIQLASELVRQYYVYVCVHMYGRGVFHLSLSMTVIHCFCDLGCISIYVAVFGVLTGMGRISHMYHYNVSHYHISPWRKCSL